MRPDDGYTTLGDYYNASHRALAVMEGAQMDMVGLVRELVGAVAANAIAHAVFLAARNRAP